MRLDQCKKIHAHVCFEASCLSSFFRRGNETRLFGHVRWSHARLMWWLYYLGLTLFIVVASMLIAYKSPHPISQASDWPLRIQYWGTCQIAAPLCLWSCSRRDGSTRSRQWSCVFLLVQCRSVCCFRIIHPQLIEIENAGKGNVPPLLHSNRSCWLW